MFIDKRKTSSGVAVFGSPAKVETISERLVQWRIENFGSGSSRRSDPFKIGFWDWRLSVNTNQHMEMMYVHLYPDDLSGIFLKPPSMARFVIRVSNMAASGRPNISPIQEASFETSKEFVWEAGSPFSVAFIIDVEFLDLKRTTSLNGEATSIWPTYGSLKILATEKTPMCLSRMFNERIHFDVSIKTADGTLGAHKAVLAASSPVFQGMFLHNMKEKESSTIEINDMSLESCRTLLSSLYGTMEEEEFYKHRHTLLHAANKYDIAELKDLCERSLIIDINSENVLDRVKDASLFDLFTLKKECFKYLFSFWKIYDVRDKIKDFCKDADKDLMQEIFYEVLNEWKPARLFRS